MTFALILSVMNIAGHTSSFVIDYDLTHQDCAQLRAEWTLTVDQYSTVTCEETTQ